MASASTIIAWTALSCPESLKARALRAWVATSLPCFSSFSMSAGRNLARSLIVGTLSDGLIVYLLNCASP